jgi:hypothetical protein
VFTPAFPSKLSYNTLHPASQSRLQSSHPTLAPSDDICSVYLIVAKLDGEFLYSRLCLVALRHPCNQPLVLASPCALLANTHSAAIAVNTTSPTLPDSSHLPIMDAKVSALPFCLLLPRCLPGNSRLGFCPPRRLPWATFTPTSPRAQLTSIPAATAPSAGSSHPRRERSSTASRGKDPPPRQVYARALCTGPRWRHQGARSQAGRVCGCQQYLAAANCQRRHVCRWQEERCDCAQRRRNRFHKGTRKARRTSPTRSTSPHQHHLEIECIHRQQIHCDCSLKTRRDQHRPADHQQPYHSVKKDYDSPPRTPR